MNRNRRWGSPAWRVCLGLAICGLPLFFIGVAAPVAVLVIAGVVLVVRLAQAGRRR